MESEPVVVLIKSITCSHCTILWKMWETPSPETGTSVVDELRKVYPKIRTAVVICKNQQGIFDENVAPSGLKIFTTWFPMILLVPGKLWDAAMAKLGPKNAVSLKEGTQIFNAEWYNNSLTYKQHYDVRKPTAFGQWLKDSLNNSSFQQASDKSATSLLKTTTPESTPKGAMSETVDKVEEKTTEKTAEKTKVNDKNMSGLIAPSQTTTSHMTIMKKRPIESSERLNKGEYSTPINDGLNMGFEGDICSMKLISRRR